MRGTIGGSLLALAVLAAVGAAWSARRGREGAVAHADGTRPEGLVFRLSEGVEEVGPATAVPPAAAESLSEAEVRKVLDRLPPFVSEEEARDFALRDKSLPPPRSGKTIETPFPPPTTATAREVAHAETLEVVRFAPEGDVPLAPQLSVTFSEPMVAVTSQEEAAGTVPVEIRPTPPGRWRWVGTKTLLFEPEGRFPMATDYEVEIPAGTRSAMGARLSKAVSWRFRTPAPTIVAHHPTNGPTRRDPVLVVVFDQRIDRDAVLATIALGAGGRLASPRAATEEEIAFDEQAHALVRGAEAGRWLAFRPASLLPSGSEIEVAVGPRTPSAEGPRLTEKAQGWTFHTYGSMRVEEHRCGWGEECRPFMPWQIRFTNPIDVERFEKGMVRVEPELPGLKAEVYGTGLTVRGASKGRTTYRVTLASGIPDVFGQTLEQEQALSFTVGKAEPALWSPGGHLVVLDPAARPTFSVYSVNQPSLKVKLYAVRPEDWPAFAGLDEGGRRAQKVPGRLVSSDDRAVNGVPDEMVETAIDLAPALSRGLGQVILDVEPAFQPEERWRRMRVRVWIQATRIGLDAFTDATEMIAWATSLGDGKPLDGVALELLPDAVAARTTADGLATLALPAAAQKILVAHLADDVAFLPERQWHWGGGWKARPVRPGLVWHVFDDRGLYRPGEEVHIKGWVRVVDPGEGGDVAPCPGALRRMGYLLQDSRRNNITRGIASVSELGAFDLVLKLPPTMNLGDAALVFRPPSGTAHMHSFSVQEFRRPEFEVKAQASDGPHFVGGHATVTATATYYAGGALPGADTSWRVTASPGSFTPPNRDDFVFGRWLPWWERSRDADGEERSQVLAGRTDSGGRHVLRIDFDEAHPARPWTVRAEASVQDVNRQAWTAAASLLVHPSSLYVGLKVERLFVQQGEPLELSAIVTDLEGAAVTGRPIDVRAVRLDWEQEGGEWQEKEVDPERKRIESAKDAVAVRFETRKGGRYRITASVADDQDRINETVVTLWVAGGQQPPRRSVEQEAVTLIPSRREYRAGETAEVLVVAPFANAEGLVTLRRSGIFRSERVTIEGTSHTLRIPIEEGWTPNVHVQVDLVGAAGRVGPNGATDPRLPLRPAFASGTIALDVPPYERTLTVTATPRDAALEPGGKTEVGVAVKDAEGAALQGVEVAFFAADEAVLALSGYELADPLATFYHPRDAGAEDHRSRAALLLGRSDDLLVEVDGQGLEKLEALGYLEGGVASGVVGGVPGGMVARNGMPPPAPQAAMLATAEMTLAEEDGEGGGAPIALRADFNPLAFWVASAVTDAEGHVSVPVTLPDSLTRYRVMAVATDGAKRFGKGEATITARLPLMVRPSAPRFLNFGDRFELPIVVQNQTDAAMTVDVAARAQNAELTEGQGRRLTVPANDRAEVRLPAAAVRAGKARFQVGAVAGRWADAAEVSLPVWTPATTEAFATYGQIDDETAVVQPVAAPKDVIAEYGGLEVTTTSTALQALTDAVLYLVAYPFECSEQLSSRILAVAALKDVLTAFDAEGLPKPEEMVSAVARDVERLRSMQNPDGGFAFWRRGDESWPYVSIHVANALVRAQGKGFAVDQATLERSRGYLRGIEGHIPKWYSDEARHTLIAYALDVRKRMGDPDPARGRKLVREVGLEKLSFEAVGWLLSVLTGDPASQHEVIAIRRFLANRATETAATAHFAVSYGDSGYVLLQSDRRADAIVLEAMIGADPKSGLIPKLVEGLLGHRKAGRWSNTQENVFILLALDRYFNTYEKVTPDFVARTWLGTRYAGEQAFHGRTTERQHVGIPMRFVAEGGGRHDLVLAKEGPGRLYYRIGMSYAPQDLNLQPVDHGFTVERTYEGVDSKGDVTRAADGAWRIRAGARVRVKLSMVATSRRYHVALVDPLPAGLEPLNPELKTTGALPRGEGEDVTVMGAPGLGGPRRPGWWWWWARRWYEHQNLRDERVEAFASLLFEGVYAYSYVARATTPGEYVVPPPRAEEMYHPETFGRGATAHVVVR